jgi:glyoxylase-like metal-dependent hydrolase (beta-lactamase superfamily II)
MSQTAQQDGSWEEPGCFEVAPNVYRIPLPLPHDGLRAVNVYAIVDDERLVLIDSGQQLDVARERLLAALGELSASPKDIGRFLVTHIHRDHYTQAVALRRDFGTHISLGMGERESIRHAASPRPNPLHDQMIELERCGARELVTRLMPSPASDDIAGHLYEEPDAWLGEEVIELSSRRLRVIATPGHTKGHVVFYDQENGLLFAGDHILPHITPSIGFEPIVYPNPLGNYLASLRHVRRLPEAKLLPAHGLPADRFSPRIDALLEHHDGRLNATRAAVEEGAATPFEVAQRLRWTRRERQLEELDAFNQMLAVMETKYHLELLVIQGHLVQAERDGLYHFTPVTPTP